MTKANLSNVLNEDDFKWKMTSNGRLPQLLKVEYLCNYWSDLSQILNLGFYDQSKPFKCFKWRQFQMEDDLKWKTTSITKSRISQQLLVPYFPNFKLKLILPKQTFQIFQKTISNGRWPQMEDYLKY